MGREQSDDRRRDSDVSSASEATDGTGRAPLSRRSYLAVAAAAVTGGVAGCVGSGEDVSTASVQPMSMYGFGGDVAYEQTSAPVTTESETNDGQHSANPIAVDTSVDGVLTSNDADWYTFEARSGATISAELDRGRDDGVAGLLLYGPDGGFLDARVVATGDPVAISATTETTGRHFLGVVDINEGTGTYSVSVTRGGDAADGTDTTPTDDDTASQTSDDGDTASTPTTTSATDGAQSSYGSQAHSIPGTVQAEDFDEGGEGVAYHDTDDRHQVTDYRSDTAVDVERSQDSTDDLSVGYAVDGEWLEYTVDVTPGTYDVHARVASDGAAPTLRVKLGDETVATVDVPDTGGWYSWETVTVEDVDLSGGTGQVLRIEMVGDGGNLNWVRFDPHQTPHGGTPHSIPGTVQAEDFDDGDEGEAYHDADVVHRGTDYRSDTGVDVERSQDSTDDLSVGYAEDQEWLEYTVDVTPGTYDLEARVASEGAGQSLRVVLDDETVGVVDVPDTDGWYTWETVTLSDVTIEATGQHVLRIEMDGAGSNLNWVRFAPAEPTGETETTTDTTTSTTTTQTDSTTTTTQSDTTTSTASGTTSADDFGEQGYGQYGYGGINS